MASDDNEKSAIPSSEKQPAHLLEDAPPSPDESIVRRPEEYFTVVLPPSTFDKLTSFGKGKKPMDPAFEQGKEDRKRDLEIIEDVFDNADKSSIYGMIEKLASRVPILTQYNLARWELKKPLLLDSDEAIQSTKDSRDLTDDGPSKTILGASVADQEQRRKRIKNNYQWIESLIQARNLHLFVSLPRDEREKRIVREELSYHISDVGKHTRYWSPNECATRVWQRMRYKEAVGSSSYTVKPVDQRHLAWVGSVASAASQLFPDLTKAEIKAIGALDDFTKGIEAKADGMVPSYSKEYMDYVSGVYRPFMVMKAALETELAAPVLNAEQMAALKIIILTIANTGLYRDTLTQLDKVKLPNGVDEAVSEYFSTAHNLAKAQYDCSMDALGLFMDDHGHPRPLDEAVDAITGLYPAVFNPPPMYSKETLNSNEAGKSSVKDDSSLIESRVTQVVAGSSKAAGKSSNTVSSTSSLSIVDPESLLMDYSEKPEPEKSFKIIRPTNNSGSLKFWENADHTDRDIRAAHAKQHRDKKTPPRLMRLADKVEGRLPLDKILDAGKNFFLASATLNSGEVVSVVLMHSECGGNRVKSAVHQIMAYINEYKRKNRNALPSITLSIKAAQDQQASTSLSRNSSIKRP